MARDNIGAFLPTTQIWEVDQLQDIDVNSPEFKELLVLLHQNINNIALIVNIKDSGYYPLTEFVNGQLYFADPDLNSTTAMPPVFRQVFRKTFNIGALAAGVTSVPHGLSITSAWTFTRIYGTASNTTLNNYYPLPFVSSAGATNIELRVDLNDIFINNNSGTTFDTTYVTLEFLKQ